MGSEAGKDRAHALSAGSTGAARRKSGWRAACMDRAGRQRKAAHHAKKALAGLRALCPGVFLRLSRFVWHQLQNCFSQKAAETEKGKGRSGLDKCLVPVLLFLKNGFLRPF